jgi:hypothetical protein
VVARASVIINGINRSKKRRKMQNAAELAGSIELRMKKGGKQKSCAWDAGIFIIK